MAAPSESLVRLGPSVADVRKIVTSRTHRAEWSATGRYPCPLARMQRHLGSDRAFAVPPAICAAAIIRSVRSNLP